MMNRFLVLDANNVVVRIERFPRGIAPAEPYVVSDDGELGQKYDPEHGTFTDHTLVPERVTMRQARLALLQNGLLSKVQPAIEGLAEPERSSVQIEWDFAQHVERSHRFIELIGSEIGVNSEQLDDLFQLAQTL